MKDINSIGRSATVRVSNKATTNATMEAPCEIRNKYCHPATHVPTRQRRTTEKLTIFSLVTEILRSIYPGKRKHIHTFIPLLKKEIDEWDRMFIHAYIPTFFPFWFSRWLLAYKAKEQVLVRRQIGLWYKVDFFKYPGRG